MTAARWNGKPRSTLKDTAMIAEPSENGKVLVVPNAADVYPGLPRDATLLILSPTKVGIDWNGDLKEDATHCRATGMTLVIGAAKRWEHVPRMMRKPDGEFYYRVTPGDHVEINFVPYDKFASCSRPPYTPTQEEGAEITMAAASEGFYGPIDLSKGETARMSWNDAGLILP